VPEGSSTLRILDPSDKQNQQVSVTGGMKMASETIRDQYGDLELTIKVEGDISNLVLAVPEQSKQHAAASQ
jgi:hypothetical protein